MPKFITSTCCILFIISLSAHPTQGQVETDATKSDSSSETKTVGTLPSLGAELAQRVERDQKARMAMIEDMKFKGGGKTKIKSDAHDAVATIDKENKAWISEQLAHNGWLGKSLVGEKGAHDAWLLVQHADQDLPFQKHCLALMSEMPKGEVSPVDIAYLTDRVLAAEGKPQRYGTQCSIENGKAVVKSVEDPDNLNRRRSELGLDPIEQYLKFVESMYVKNDKDDQTVKPLISVDLPEKFNGNILVVKNGKTVFEKSVGFADGLNKVPLSTGHRFNVGSIFKELPAVAIMQLQEDGLVRLDDKVSKFLPTLPNWANDVSIKNLLQYTSGLPRVNWGNFEVVNDANLTRELHAFKKLEFSPGDGYLYTNYSPLLLEKIVETVTKESFPGYTKKHLFEPAGMTNSAFPDEFPYSDRDQMAIPFDKEFVEDQLPFKISGLPFLFATTANDMHRWLDAIHSGKLITKDSLLLISENAAIAGVDTQSPLGNVVVKNNEIVQHQHHGSSGNFESLIVRNNHKQTTIILMTNSKTTDLFKLSKQIAKQLE